MRQYAEKFGAIFWILAIQYYLVQIIAALAWKSPYSLSNNYISDLGNTVCGIYANKSVCSPLHSAMNFSFILLGVCTILGVILLFKQAWVGKVLVGLGGVGLILVGLFPENTIFSLHYLGAVLAFVPGNIGMIVIGFSLQGWRRYFSIAMGLIGAVGTILFSKGVTIGIGMGGMERVAAYPLSIWMIILGTSYILELSGDR